MPSSLQKFTCITVSCKILQNIPKWKKKLLNGLKWSWTIKKHKLPILLNITILIMFLKNVHLFENTKNDIIFFWQLTQIYSSNHQVIIFGILVLGKNFFCSTDNIKGCTRLKVIIDTLRVQPQRSDEGSDSDRG